MNVSLIFEGNLNLETFHVGSVQEFKDRDKKVELCHTLNGSGVATPRLMVALIETYQTSDGKVSFPK